MRSEGLGLVGTMPAIGGPAQAEQCGSLVQSQIRLPQSTEFVPRPNEPLWRITPGKLARLDGGGGGRRQAGGWSNSHLQCSVFSVHYSCSVRDVRFAILSDHCSPASAPASRLRPTLQRPRFAVFIMQHRVRFRLLVICSVCGSHSMRCRTATRSCSTGSSSSNDVLLRYRVGVARERMQSRKLRACCCVRSPSVPVT